jgi:alpha-D-ribose 1-methylphosphonate 5-triphosphate synthase subunit PhnH
MQNASFDGGLADPVYTSQAVFRAIMDAFSNPGSVASLSGHAAGPAPLGAAASAILLTLADYDTPVLFEDSESTQDAAAWLTFHTGAPASSDPSKAALVVLSEGSHPAQWHEFACGTVNYPDRSATVLLPVQSLTGGTALELSGPGIETTRQIAADGLGSGFVAWAQANHASYPLGLDLVLVCNGDALALPRTTRIREI